MKRKSFLYRSVVVLAGALALAANAHAGTILIDFSEVIVFETDTFETSGGATLFTSNGVGYGDWLSPNIAADLAAAAVPGYSVVGGNSPQPVVNVSYTTGAIEPDGSLIDGTVTFDIVQENIVEQPAAVPEPSTFALTIFGWLALWRLRIQRTSRR